jgi:CHAT domain-containing protein
VRAGRAAWLLAAALAAVTPTNAWAEEPAECPADPEQAAAPADAALVAADRVRTEIEAGRTEGAERELSELAARAESLPDSRQRARLLLHLARSQLLLAERTGDPPEARARAAPWLARAAEVADDPRDRSYALGGLAELAEADGRDAEALDLSRRALRAALDADAPDALWRWQWQVARLHRRAGREAQALEQYRQAAATLAELRRQAQAAAATWTASPERRPDRLYLELADLLLERAARGADPAEAQALLAQTRDVLEARKAEELLDYFQDECLLAQAQAAAEDVPGTAVVYPVVLEDRLEILVGGGGRLERFEAPVGRAALEAEARAFRATLVRRTTREYLPHAQQLYEWLVSPIEAALEARAPETLVFVPDGPLRAVPVAALHDARRDQFLIERWALAIVPSLALTDPRPIAPGKVQMLAAGISQPVAGFPPLYAVTGEIEALDETFSGRSLLNAEFEIARFEREVERQPFGIVHIASHGEFSEDPAKSFLLAYDGRLSMDRLAALVSTTRFRAEQPLELLTLSACETAAGSDRAALGLAGVALRSGARSALASLWAVNDVASAELIVAFYRELAEGQVSRARALQRAQLAMLEHRGFRHPALWSAFVLISSWL